MRGGADLLRLGSASFDMKKATASAMDDFNKRKANPYLTGEKFVITKAQAKSYGTESFLVQSSPEPINLGKDMGPYMNLEPLVRFMKEQGIQKKENSPEEVFLYHWTHGAQGKMIFQTGFAVEDTVVLPAGTTSFKIVKLPATKFSSVFYEGPFPGRNGSGWEKIQWAERAKEAGIHYNEVLYRELYHKIGRATGERNLTEIEISID